MALDLGKQIGPLPLGAWIVVVGGGLGIALYARKQNAADTIVEDTGGQPGVGDGSVGGWVPTQPPAATPTPDPKTAVTNNDEWYAYVFSELVARNYDATLVDSALRKYLAGLSSKLSVGEWVIIRMALAIMPPPSPIPASPDDPNPPGAPIPPPSNVPGPVKPPTKPTIPKPPAPKPRYRYYTVRKGDNLWNIARKYYGSGAQFVRIYGANRAGKKRADGKPGMITNPSLIKPGWVLLIP